VQLQENQNALLPTHGGVAACRALTCAMCRVSFLASFLASPACFLQVTKGLDLLEEIMKVNKQATKSVSKTLGLYCLPCSPCSPCYVLPVQPPMHACRLLCVSVCASVCVSLCARVRARKMSVCRVLCVCVCACVRACVREFLRACERASERARNQASVRACELARKRKRKCTGTLVDCMLIAWLIA
jgi:hypothetical protein